MYAPGFPQSTGGTESLALDCLACATILLLTTHTYSPSPPHECMRVNSVITFVVWEANSERNLPNLLPEQVSLVEEEYDGSARKGKVIDNVAKQPQALMHAVLYSKKGIGYG